MDLIGKQVGDFFIQSRIAQNDRAAIYLAYQISVERSVALKIIIPDSSESVSKFHVRFYAEMASIIALEHLHIVPIYKYGIIESDGSAFIATRLMSASLADMLSNGKPLHIEQVEQIFQHVSGALNYAHQKGVIHGGLRPSNVLLDEEGNAYISDFGLGRIAYRPERTPLSGLRAISNYLAPEQIQGSASDELTDQFNLGALMYQMLAGNSPYETHRWSVIQRFFHREHRQPLDLVALNPSVSPVLKTAILRAMRSVPSERYINMDEMIRTFDGVLRETVWNAPRLSTDELIMHRTEARRTAARQAARHFSSNLQNLSSSGLWGRLSLMVVMLTIVSVIVFLAVAYGSRFSAAQGIPARILRGVRGVPADVIPTGNEIDTALSGMGATGFIAYVACNLTSETHIVRAREMREIANAYGFNFVIYDSGMNETIQLGRIDQARRAGAKALIVCPLGANIIEALESPANDELPFILTHDSEYDPHEGVAVGVDNYELGARAGRIAGNLINLHHDGSARVVILRYDHPPHLSERTNGVRDGLLEVAPDVDMIGTFECGTRTDAESAITGLIERGTQFDFIITATDIGAYGAVDALEAAAIPTDEVSIVSIEAESLARNYVERGHYIRATMRVNRMLEAQAAIQAIIKLLGGGETPQTIAIPIGEPFVMVSSLLAPP